MPVNHPPTSTETQNGWSPVGALDLHEAVQVDDAGTTYIACSDGTSCKLVFDASDHPNSTAGHVLRVISQKAVDTSQTCTLRAELYTPGDVLIHSFDIDEPASFALASEAIPEAVLEALTSEDYAGMKVLLIDVASPLTAEHQIEFVELELPDRILRAHVSG